MNPHPQTGSALPHAALWSNGAEYCPVSALLRLGVREGRLLWAVWTEGKPLCGPGNRHAVHFGDGGSPWLITPLTVPVPGLEDWMTVVSVEGREIPAGSRLPPVPRTADPGKGNIHPMRPWRIPLQDR